MANVNPQPLKPRPPKRIDYRSLKLAKAVPDRNDDYLRFVRSQVCATWSNECGGVTEAAHVEGFGRGKKASDFLTIPLCSKCHAHQHAIGIRSFQIERQVNVYEIACRLLVRWIRGERAE